MNDFIKDPRVSNGALNAFYKRNARSGEVHSIHLLHHGETVLRIAIPPYKADDKRESYSLSKTFIATAIGVLVTDGKLSLDARIVDLFPDKCPEVISENLGKMRLRHVLSMNTGHEACTMTRIAFADDAVRAFLALDVEFEPGTHFTYNTGASCILACLVEKITGMPALDYLTAKVLIPMGITGVSWLTVSGGQSQGGCGIHVSCDDIARLGQLYLNGGVWNGKRFLSEEWVREATSKISDNTGNGSPDWCAGYGFQIWQNAREGYRGDGAFGQLMVVFPERDMVVAIQGLLGDMWGEVESVYDLVEDLYKESDEPLCLPDYSPLSSEQKTSGLEDGFYILSENPMDLTGMYLTYDSDKDEMCINLSNSENTEVVRAGNGHWVDNVVFINKIKPNMPDFQPTHGPARTELSASYTAEDGKLVLSVRFRNCPHPMTWTITGDCENIKLEIEDRGFMSKGAAELAGKKFHG